MNNTPCPLCNHFHAARYVAFIRREYKELERIEAEHEEHKKTCQVLNSSWYMGLWQNAKVGTDVYPNCHWLGA